jgi:hypothetical protein
MLTPILSQVLVAGAWGLKGVSLLHLTRIAEFTQRR